MSNPTLRYFAAIVAALAPAAAGFALIALLILAALAPFIG